MIFEFAPFIVAGAAIAGGVFGYFFRTLVKEEPTVPANDVSSLLYLTDAIMAGKRRTAKQRAAYSALRTRFEV